jgi:hypothetical protein
MGASVGVRKQQLSYTPKCPLLAESGRWSMLAIDSKQTFPRAVKPGFGSSTESRIPDNLKYAATNMFTFRHLLRFDKKAVCGKTKRNACTFNVLAMFIRNYLRGALQLLQRDFLA